MCSCETFCLPRLQELITEEFKKTKNGHSQRLTTLLSIEMHTFIALNQNPVANTPVDIFANAEY